MSLGFSSLFINSCVKKPSLHDFSCENRKKGHDREEGNFPYFPFAKLSK